MPPIQTELMRIDFDNAVTTFLYLFEDRAASRRLAEQASRTGLEVARVLAPLFGGEVKDYDDSQPFGHDAGGPLDRPRGCEHIFVDGVCRGCGMDLKPLEMARAPRASGEAGADS